jgi:hypothetical protein
VREVYGREVPDRGDELAADAARSGLGETILG